MAKTLTLKGGKKRKVTGDTVIVCPVHHCQREWGILSSIQREAVLEGIDTKAGRPCVLQSRADTVRLRNYRNRELCFVLHKYNFELTVFYGDDGKVISIQDGGATGDRLEAENEGFSEIYYLITTGTTYDKPLPPKEWLCKKHVCSVSSLEGGVSTQIFSWDEITEEEHRAWEPELYEDD